MIYAGDNVDSYNADSVPAEMDYGPAFADYFRSIFIAQRSAVYEAVYAARMRNAIYKAVCNG